MVDELRAEHVQPLLRGRLGHVYTYVDRCESTQRLFPESAPEGAVAVADEQVAGRGRLGRRWDAPKGTSVLCSIVLRPEVDPSRLPELSLVAGRACAAALAEVAAITPTVKFPNDVLVEGRKVAGILAEARDGRVVLGVGINVTQTEQDLPAGTETPPTSLLLAAGRRIGRVELLVALLAHLEREYDAWTSRQG